MSPLRYTIIALLITGVSLVGFTVIGSDALPNQMPDQASSQVPTHAPTHASTHASTHAPNIAPNPRPIEALGSWKIINYWSTTCAPCRIEIPELNLLFDELAASSIQVLGVNFDEDDRKTTLRLARRLGIEFPTLNLSEVEALGLPAPSALPTTYIVSPTNEVLTKLVGIQTKASIYTLLTELAIPH